MLAAVEPLTGQRLYHVHTRRTKADYTCFMQELAARSPAVETICVGQDTLTTPSATALYEHLPAAQAHALARCFPFLYTPKSASWLHRLELDCCALARPWLNRRIPTQTE